MTNEKFIGLGEQDVLEEIYQDLYASGHTDGLPVIPPTEERVRKMISACGLPPIALIGQIPPAGGKATVEKIAINAVMAGCLPEHLPLIITILKAMLEPEYNLLGIASTTGAACPCIVFNGPIRYDVEINGGANCLGPGWRANATIGRAISLCLLNIGGAIPGSIDMATLGWPGKYSFCFAENEEESPWDPLHYERGFARSDSVVTVMGSVGVLEVVDGTSITAEGALSTMAYSMNYAGNMGGADRFGTGNPIAILTPEIAAIVARGGLSKSQAREFLWEHAKHPLERLSPEIAERIVERRKEAGKEELNAPLRITAHPDEILLIVAGGIGIKSAFIPSWGGETRAISKVIEIVGY
jgi:hypothetical protein